jgi:2-oxoglutarate ferredoxin oxidoreductase subunit alpha
MSAIDVTFRLGGEAGQGVESSGAGFTKALVRAGLEALAVADYMSRIRGGHNFFTIRASDRPVLATREHVHLLIALTGETVARHVEHLVPGGVILCDETLSFDETVLQGKPVQLLRAPLVAIAEGEGDRVMANTAALAIAAGLTGLELAPLLSVIADNFRKKGSAIVEQNTRVAQTAYTWAQERSGMCPWKLQARARSPRLTLSGSQAFAMGALAAGCKFVAGYPMTPATPVLEYMAQHAAAWGLVVKHAESEIAAINMCVGAAHAGARAMAPTSGGGFDLMTEGVSLAAMLEDPIVVYLAQRPGPATGLPTRTAQSDLFLALHASHGEYARIIMAPHTPEEAFCCAVRAFNLAEKYQCPVIVLSDEYLAASIRGAEPQDFDVQHTPIQRGKLLSQEELDALATYKRYALTEDGVSPRALPGMGPKALYFSTSDEHTEEGHITEDPQLATAMAQKRLRKLEYIAAEMRPPLLYGPQEAELTFIGWGSSYGAIREAVDLLNAQGRAANMVHFVDLWPFPAQGARQALAGAKRIVAVEGNATAQFAFLLQAHAGIVAQQKILKYDGRGFTPDYILARLEA